MLTRTRRRAAATRDGSPEWSRAQMLAAVGLGAGIVLVLVAGAGLWLWYRLHPAGLPTSTVPVSPGAGVVAGASTPTAGPGSLGEVGNAPLSQLARRDALAAEPMPAASPAAALPAVLSTRDPGVIVLPAASLTGPVGVPSGFTHTPEGALGQLVAIDVDVLGVATLEHAREVIGSWAAPGGPTGQSWSAIKALASFHSAAGLSGGASPGLAMRATPMMGLVKATDGPDWAVVCVDFEVDATMAKTARIAAADCQRMTWHTNPAANSTGVANTGRWVIAVGAEPAQPPSIWPGTDAAINAGYRNLRQG